jgi:hypothetical protein
MALHFKPKAQSTGRRRGDVTESSSEARAKALTLASALLAGQFCFSQLRPHHVPLHLPAAHTRLVSYNE